MQIATDSTAGERERGSLEPLLVNPAPRVVFVGRQVAAPRRSPPIMASTRTDDRDFCARTCRDFCRSRT